VIASHLLAAYEAVPDADDAEELKGRAAAALVRAGERAKGLAAATEAQRYFEQAAELVDDESARADLAARAGEMAWQANRPAEARVLLERAHAAYEQLADPIGAARVASRLADIDFNDGHPPQAAARLEPALAALEEAGAEADIAAVAAQLGRFLYFSGDAERAAVHLERALSLAEALDQRETLAEALNTKAGLVFARLHRPREAQILLEGALAIALANDLHSAALRAYNNLGAYLWVVGQWHAFIGVAGRALELARKVGDRRWESQFLGAPSGVLMMLGRWDEALDLAAEAEEIAETEFASALLLQLAPIHVYRGILDRVRELLAENESIARSENPGWAAGYALTGALLHAAEGRADDALAAVDRGLAVRNQMAGGQSFVRFLAFEAASEIADEDKLRELLEIADEMHAGERGAFLRAQQARFRARLPEHDPEAELRTAERLFAEAEMPFHVAATHLEHGEHLLAKGRGDEARPLFEQARETFEQLGAKPWVERLEAAASSTGVPA